MMERSKGMKIGCVVTIVEGASEKQAGEDFPLIHIDSLATEAEWLKGIGIEAVQVGFKCAVDEARMKVVKEGFESRGIAVAALSGYADFLSDEARWFVKDVAELCELIDMAGRADIGVVITWGGFGDTADADNRRRVLSCLADACQAARRAGVRVAVELYDKCVIGTPRAIVGAAEELEVDNLGISMDPPNVMRAEDVADQRAYMERIFSEADGKIFIAHAKDVTFEGGERKFPGPGEGVLDYKEYVRALRAANYAGALFVEHVRGRAVADAVSYVRRFLG